MKRIIIHPRPLRSSLTLLLVAILACGFSGTVQAQIRQVRVGITPSCNNGYPVCWPAAAEGLSLLPGVLAAEDAIAPDFSTCTAIVAMRGNRLPDLPEWHRRFREVAGEQQHLRGVEITIAGKVALDAGKLLLRAPGLSEPIPLEPLGSSAQKLDYSFKEKKSPAFSAAERRTHADLTAALQGAPGKELNVTVVGLLCVTADRPRLEIAHFVDQESSRQQGSRR